MVAFCGTVTPEKRSPIQWLPKLRMDLCRLGRLFEPICLASSLRAAMRLLTELLMAPPEPKV